MITKIAKFMGPILGPPGICRPQMGPMNLAIWVLFSRNVLQVLQVLIFWTPNTWWRHQMETFSALLALCDGNSPVTSEFSSQRPVTRSIDVFFNLRLNKWLNKQSRRRGFETPLRLMRRHCNVLKSVSIHFIIWYSTHWTMHTAPCRPL